jgi:hypothetical protein
MKETFDPHPLKSYDTFTKGQIYIFYKDNINYFDGGSATTQQGNFWYFVTITGKENQVNINIPFDNPTVTATDRHGKQTPQTVPYGHTDEMIANPTTGANFGTSATNITDYSHYLTDQGVLKQSFPLNEIMGNYNSAAYAIKVNNQYDKTGQGYVIEGSVFETDSNRGKQIKYTPDATDGAGNIQLNWS